MPSWMKHFVYVSQATLQTFNIGFVSRNNRNVLTNVCKPIALLSIASKEFKLKLKNFIGFLYNFFLALSINSISSWLDELKLSPTQLLQTNDYREVTKSSAYSHLLWTISDCSANKPTLTFYLHYSYILIVNYVIYGTWKYIEHKKWKKRFDKNLLRFKLACPSPFYDVSNMF